jgi:Peptidase family M23
MRRLALHLATTFLAFLLLVPPARAEWIWPTHGEVITPYRNGTDPYASGQHRGIDIAAATGATVAAAAGGEVRFVGTAGSSGLTVSVRTADGRYDTSYLHLSSTSVREGDGVAAGQLLGAVGTTGTRSATAPHLHFGVRDAGTRHAYHDPLGFLPPPTPTEPPRGAPAPEAAPVPVSPAPAPARVRAPATRRIPVREPAPRPVPAGEPRRVPAGAPDRVPSAEPGSVPRAAPGHVAAPDRAPSAEPGRAPAGEPALVPAATPRQMPGADPRRVHGADSARAPAGQSGHARTGAAVGWPAARGSTSANPSSSSGPDLGLLAACLGLLAAAAVLGLTGDGRKATRETGHRIARVLQPILGRR